MNEQMMKQIQEKARKRMIANGYAVQDLPPPPPPKQEAPQKKQEIKGNQQQFSNAKKMLEMNLGKAGIGGTGNLPPPPSLSGLPPPPPPPSLSGLPPPPPPPPSNFNSGNLAPPPRLSQILGSSSTPATTTKVNNQIKMPPPPPPPPMMNLPPPPPPPPLTMNLPKVPPPPPPSSKTTGMSNLPPPPPPPPASFSSDLAPPPRLSQVLQGIQSSNPQLKNPQNNLPPPPPPPPSAFLKDQAKYKNDASTLPPPPPPPPLYSAETKQNQTPPQVKMTEGGHKYTHQPIFGNKDTGSTNRKDMTSPNVAQKTGSQEKKLAGQIPGYMSIQQAQRRAQQQSQKRMQQLQQQQQQSTQYQQPQQQQQWQQPQYQQTQQISKTPPKTATTMQSPPPTIKSSSSITAQFFKSDISGYLKREFIRQTDILSVIGTLGKKSTHMFYFPTIQNDVRKVEPIETFYADVDNLTLASCYRQKNMNSIKVHTQSRDKFVSTLKNYNWNADPEKLKTLLSLNPAVQQSGNYREPNFCAIKDCLNLCDKTIANFVKFQNFNGCAEVKKLKDEIEQMIGFYIKNPEGNEKILDEIDKKMLMVKDLKK